ncbi:MAG: hypothetical protein ACYC91_14865 [Solirubrobacteraceae bacterium]
MTALAEAPTLFGAWGDDPTLDDVVVGAWDGLMALEVVPCPVCGAGLEPVHGVHPRPTGGRCRGCGSWLF